MHRGGIIVAIALLAAGCESTKIGMYDGETSCTDDGGASLRKCDTGAVAVLDPETEEERGLIDRSDTRSKVNQRGAKVRETTRDNLNARYFETLSAMPTAARSFTLKFVKDKDDELSDSGPTLRALLAEVADRRESVDVDIIGHSDTSGDDDGNLKLSRDRAEFVKALLMKEGLSGDVIHVSARGELEPIDNPSNKNFASEVNRRVEVLVK